MDPNDLKVSSRYIFQELRERGVATEIMSTRYSVMRFKHPNKGWQYLKSVISQNEPAIGLILSKNKSVAYAIANRLEIPHPKTLLIRSVDEVENIKLTKPWAVKPLDSAHGNGISTNLQSKNMLVRAIKFAQKFSSTVLVQENVQGDDYRLLYINKQYVAALKRSPACVTGDGKSSLLQLIENENHQNKNRGAKKASKMLDLISLEAAKQHLGDSIHNVPKAGEKICVVGVSNLSKGGSVTDVTDEVPKNMIDLGLKMAQETGLGVCGIDFIWNGDIDAKPCFLEINATPGIGMHDNFDKLSDRIGSPGRITKAFVDYLLL